MAYRMINSGAGARGRYKLPCPEGGPGYGRGGGRGKGLIRVDLQGGEEAVTGIGGIVLHTALFAMTCIGAYTTLKWAFKR